MKSVKFLNEKGFTDMTLNPYDLPEYQVSLTKLLDEYAALKINEATTNYQKAIKIDDEIINGTEHKFGIVECLSGYYSDMWKEGLIQFKELNGIKRP